MDVTDEALAPRPDLRTVLLAVCAWSGALLGFLLSARVNLAMLAGGLVWLLVRYRSGRSVLMLSACLATAAAAGCGAQLRAEINQNSPVADLAHDGALVSVELRVTSDPVLRDGEYAPYMLVRGKVTEVTGRGRTRTTHVPVLLIADVSWRAVELGSRVRATGRLRPPDGPELAAVLSTGRPPEVLAEPGDLFGRAAEARAGIRASVERVPQPERSLVPALVVGDDRGMPAGVTESFQTSGLTHLLAVSGTNLTLVVGFVLIVARWLGVRARGLVVVGVLGVAGFVLLARAEPSVVRAAAMGSVALVAMGSDGRQKGVRAIGVAVLMLLLFDPWLALSLGFVLSALATAGILFLAPPWRDALTRWLPRWAAEVVSVPLAAQLVCTPVVAAISGQVSLVAVAANMLVAPAVGPATVLGLVGGLVTMFVEPLGQLIGRGAGWCGWWIVSVAEHSSALPTAAVEWSAEAMSIAGLSVLCVVLVLVIPHVLGHRPLCVAITVVLLVVIARPAQTFSWPPDGWVLVACDVGQGDGLVLNAGDGRAVLVDVGPDPKLIDRCLDRLEVRAVPVVVLTHFHADHIDGLPGVLEEHQVGEIAVTGLRDPEQGAAAVSAWAAAEGVPVQTPVYGEVRELGPLRWQVVGPPEAMAAGRSGEEGSGPNNASLALLVDAGGARILLTGDMEPQAQALMERTVVELRVDVLKVPHHGSRYQDAEFLSGLGAGLAVISTGADNDYGHPAEETLDLLRGAGMLVRRTDLHGDIAVVVEEGSVRVVTAREP